jgi:hypothetical protein
MPCKLNNNLICLGLGPLFLETNLNLLINKNARFHWTLLLGPLSKVTLTLHEMSKFSKSVGLINMVISSQVGL